jgi:hypothetical protein
LNKNYFFGENTDNYVECANLADQILMNSVLACHASLPVSFSTKILHYLCGSQFHTNLKKTYSEPRKKQKNNADEKGISPSFCIFYERSWKEAFGLVKFL